MNDFTEYGKNYNLRDEIKAYWSERAATFDLSPGHEIFSEEERDAWHALILKHLGPGEGRTALDLASGTGVVSHLMDDLGFKVTGIDWSENMLELARAKSKYRGRSIRFFIGDAENTMEPDASFDVIVTRHLVWTLVNPKASFAEWYRILKPGGRLLIIDGDFVNVGLPERMIRKLSAGLERFGLIATEAKQSSQMADTFRSILSRVYFAHGALTQEVENLLSEAGFAPIVADLNLKNIHRAQARHFSFLKGLSRGLQHRYAIIAEKPAG